MLRFYILQAKWSDQCDVIEAIIGELGSAVRKVQSLSTGILADSADGEDFLLQLYNHDDLSFVVAERLSKTQATLQQLVGAIIRRGR